MKDHEINWVMTEVDRGGKRLMDNAKRQCHWVGGLSKTKRVVAERMLEEISFETVLIDQQVGCSKSSCLR